MAAAAEAACRSRAGIVHGGLASIGCRVGCPLSKNRARNSSGFTLVEVTVALAVAALGLGLLMAAAGTGLRNAMLADQYIDATRRAQSHLAEIGRLAPLRPGLQLGND